jgi:O-acetyl-ADP-ribose deacetylase (regulator of RNase III)
VSVTVVRGDLLEHQVEVIVNAWNRNVIPWWLLVPQGVSGAIRRRAGVVPFRELGRHGPIPLGGAVLTSAGKLPFRAIIHVAAIGLTWTASERSIRGGTVSALQHVKEREFRSVAFPILGTGTGGFDVDRGIEIMLAAVETFKPTAEVLLVRFA